MPPPQTSEMYTPSFQPPNDSSGPENRTLDIEAGYKDASGSDSNVEGSHEPDELAQYLVDRMLQEIAQLEIKVSKLEEEAARTTSSLRAIKKLTEAGLQK